ncbi:MAG TPA: MoaD/ThiS family protein [Bacteroidota bacterium]|nr:MoaD/ThiS family protein [Bacteroidota bacterium]
MARQELTVTVRLFSVARDIAGCDMKKLRVPEGSSADVILRELAKTYPRLDAWVSSIRLAVNEEYVSNEHTLCDGDDVAVIPPVSGG